MRDDLDVKHLVGVCEGRETLSSGRLVDGGDVHHELMEMVRVVGSAIFPRAIHVYQFATACAMLTWSPSL